VGPELFDRAGLCTTGIPESFLPVTEPICAAGIGVVPRLGDLLGFELETAEDDSGSSWALR
jgi:hypothetical protein